MNNNDYQKFLYKVGMGAFWITLIIIFLILQAKFQHESWWTLKRQ